MNQRLLGCAGCPMVDDIASNLGCLPDESEIIKLTQEGFIWGCHSSKEGCLIPCAGLCNMVRLYPDLYPGVKLDLKGGKLIDPEIYYREGMKVAKDKAIPRKGSEKWQRDTAIAEWNKHYRSVYALFQEKFPTQAELNAAYHAEMDKRLAHTGWGSKEILEAIFKRAEGK